MPTLSTDPVAIATLQVSRIGAVATIFLGLLATLISYDSLFRAVTPLGRSRFDRGGLLCDIAEGAGGKVCASLSHSGIGSLTINSIEIFDAGGRLIQTASGVVLHRNQHKRWTILSPNFERPELIVLVVHCGGTKGAFVTSAAFSRGPIGVYEFQAQTERRYV